MRSENPARRIQLFVSLCKNPHDLLIRFKFITSIKQQCLYNLNIISNHHNYESQTGNRPEPDVYVLPDSSIAEDSFVRVVDAFVETIDLKSFGFAHVECREEGRPPYHPSVLLKLYLYGYHYGIRTTRKLERETQTNMECMWLLKGLRPKYKTIADFRKNHPRAFREVFRRFVCLLKQWNLIEGETVAIDSFKIRGNNSLRNNFNEKKLKQHLEYIDKQITEYQDMLDTCDKQGCRRHFSFRSKAKTAQNSLHRG